MTGGEETSGADAPGDDAVGGGEERLLESRPVFEGRLLRVSVDRVALPDGQTAEREVVRHPGAAGVLPLFEASARQEGPAVLLVRQYRHPVGRALWEIPAGTLEPGESPEACARRELEEEAGLRARELQSLGVVHTSAGFTDEAVHVFAVDDPERGRPRPGDQERLERRMWPFRSAVRMVERGEITDAKTVFALLTVARRRSLGGADEAGGAPGRGPGNGPRTPGV